MTEPESTGRPVARPGEVRLETAKPDPVERLMSFAVLLLFLLLVAVCVIGGIGLHYLNELRHF